MRGRDSLHAKVLGFLGQLADGGAGERATCLRATGGSSEKATDALLCALGGSTVAEQCDRGALFVSDTPQQLQRATRLLQSLRDMRANQRTACAGQFLLIIDEADAMQRTDGEEREPIQLERRLITLLGGKQDADGVWRALGDNPADKSKASLLAEQFWGPQACVSISATLLPVFLRVHRGAQRAKDKAAEAAHAAAEAAAQAAADGGVVPAPPVVAALPPAILHPFYTSEKMGDYVGVMSDLWLPFQADCPDGSKADAFLPDRALNLKNRGVDEGGLVMALYKHAVERPHSLLLDVTVVRVNADNNVRLCSSFAACCALHAVAALQHCTPVLMRTFTSERTRGRSLRRRATCGASSRHSPSWWCTAWAARSSCRRTRAAALSACSSATASWRWASC